MANPLCHFELMSNDVDRCREFYGKLFGWKFDDQTMPGYTLINTGTEPSGGLMAKPDDAPSAGLSVYFQVDDLDAALEQAKQLGGRVLVPNTPIPNVGAFAMIADPEGIVMGLLKTN